jgi:tetratricopeptide (TPR) repeat protein
MDEAEQANKELRSLNPDDSSAHFATYVFAFLRGDQATMESEIQWARGKPEEADFSGVLASAALYNGQFKKGEELIKRSVEMFKSQDRKENASQLQIGFAGNLAVIGSCQQAKENATAGLALWRGRVGLPSAALVFATCNDLAQAQSLLDEALRLYPKDTAAAYMMAPVIRAKLESNRGNVAQAIQLLESVRNCDFGLIMGLINNYARGQTYLQQRSGKEAAAEFQKIIDRSGIEPLSPLHALAHLGLARAAAINADSTKSRKEYQDFFGLWKNADADLPILVQAKKEYEQVK